jgi:hypothetical protein
MEPHSANVFAETASTNMIVIDIKSDFIKAPPFPLDDPRELSQGNFLSVGLADPVVNAH